MFDKEKTRKKKALLTVALYQPKGNGISAARLVAKLFRSCIIEKAAIMP
jgi:hypothetical protein